MMTLFKVLVFLIVSAILWVESGPAHAATAKDSRVLGDFSFEKNLEYDIYFSSFNGGLAIIENTEILGIKEVGGKRFLVIKSKGFKLEEGEGYVLFDSIAAILPDRNFKVNKESANGTNVLNW